MKRLISLALAFTLAVTFIIPVSAKTVTITPSYKTASEVVIDQAVPVKYKKYETIYTAGKSGYIFFSSSKAAVIYTAENGAIDISGFGITEIDRSDNNGIYVKIGGKIAVMNLKGELLGTQKYTDLIYTYQYTTEYTAIYDKPTKKLAVFKDMQKVCEITLTDDYEDLLLGNHAIVKFDLVNKLLSIIGGKSGDEILAEYSVSIKYTAPKTKSDDNKYYDANITKENDVVKVNNLTIKNSKVYYNNKAIVNISPSYEYFNSSYVTKNYILVKGDEYDYIINHKTGKITKKQRIEKNEEVKGVYTQTFSSILVASPENDTFAEYVINVVNTHGANSTSTETQSITIYDANLKKLGVLFEGLSRYTNLSLGGNSFASTYNESTSKDDFYSLTTRKKLFTINTNKERVQMLSVSGDLLARFPNDSPYTYELYDSSGKKFNILGNLNGKIVDISAADKSDICVVQGNKSGNFGLYVLK